MRVMVIGLLVLLTGASAPLIGQRPEGPPAERRAQLEGRFQQQLATMLRERLQLSDEQLQRLTATNARFEQRRRAILVEEMQGRRALRHELMRNEAADQNRISALIERNLRLQRQRLDLVEEEQRELAQFLTPRQRALFLSTQEQIRRRADEVRRQRPRGGERSGRRPGGGTPR